MTRTEKLRLIEKYRPSLYLYLKKNTTILMFNPDNAPYDEIEFYNKAIVKEAKRDNNNEAFKRNFSF